MAWENTQNCKLWLQGDGWILGLLCADGSYLRIPRGIFNTLLVAADTLAAQRLIGLNPTLALPACNPGGASCFIFLTNFNSISTRTVLLGGLNSERGPGASAVSPPYFFF